MSFLIRGTSSPGPPYTLSREPLRRLAPFAWLASLARAGTRRYTSAMPDVLPYPGDVVPRTPLHALSRAASSARSVRVARFARSRRYTAVHVSHARCPSLSGGRRPPDPLTRSLASRFVGSLRSRGSLRSLAPVHGGTRQPCQMSLVRRSSHDDCKARASAAPSSDGAGVSARYGSESEPKRHGRP